MGWGELGLGDIRGVLSDDVNVSLLRSELQEAYLVGVVGSGGGGLALLAAREFSQIAVVVSLPVALFVRTTWSNDMCVHSYAHNHEEAWDLHLVVEDLALARLGLGDETLVKHIEHIVTHILQLRLDLLAVVADDADVLVGALGLLFLLDAGDDTPRSATGADHVLVGHGEQVTLVNGKFAADLRSLC